MTSLPNIVLPLLVSPIAERIGMKKTILLYTSLMIIGFSLEYIGSVIDNTTLATTLVPQTSLTGYWILLAGICIFGIGVNGSLVILSNKSYQNFLFSIEFTKNPQNDHTH